MGRPKKKQKVLNCRLNEDIYRLLEDYSSTYGHTKTFVVEQALAQYISMKYEEQKLLDEYRKHKE